MGGNKRFQKDEGIPLVDSRKRGRGGSVEPGVVGQDLGRM